MTGGRGKIEFLTDYRSPEENRNVIRARLKMKNVSEGVIEDIMTVAEDPACLDIIITLSDADQFEEVFNFEELAKME